jgi:hypothetical protein
MDEKAFICLLQILEKCKKWGYTEVWINHINPHWKHVGASGMIVAAPQKRNGSWPAIWSLGHDPLEREMIGQGGCGNGLAHADQMQFSRVSKNYDALYYRLNNGRWLTEGEIYGSD